MTHRLATNYAKNYCNQMPIVKVIVENVVTCFFWGHGVQINSMTIAQSQTSRAANVITVCHEMSRNISPANEKRAEKFWAGHVSNALSFS